MFVAILLGFPRFDKRVGHRLSVISFLSLLTSIPLIFYRCRRGIDYRRYPYARLDAKQKLPFADADGDRARD
jgi:hypothetical protein